MHPRGAPGSSPGRSKQVSPSGQRSVSKRIFAPTDSSALTRRSSSLGAHHQRCSRELSWELKAAQSVGAKIRFETDLCPDGLVCFGAKEQLFWSPYAAWPKQLSPSAQRSVSGSVSESVSRSRTWLTNRRFENPSYLTDVSLENSKDNSLLRKKTIHREVAPTHPFLRLCTLHCEKVLRADRSSQKIHCV